MIYLIGLLIRLYLLHGCQKNERYWKLNKWQTLRDEIIPKINEIFDPKKFKVAVTGNKFTF
ncbi:MAG: hypothetical protein CM15mV100_050 [uncultured marine virus]|nr:MAG: hypothetical protein CM15mV100_050 [uncultured marine virus]